MIISLGSNVRTPKFLNVRIAAMFENVELAEDCGFTETTLFLNQDYIIRGKCLGNNRMLFAAIPRF
jgi:hypothetical protein